jgi:hypothetical protein
MCDQYYPSSKEVDQWCQDLVDETEQASLVHRYSPLFLYLANAWFIAHV